MLLNPTLNSSLSATSNSIAEIEGTRQRMSTPIYVYEMNNGHVDLHTEKIIYGMKSIARNGITHSSGVNYTIRYNDLTGHLRSGTS